MRGDFKFNKENRELMIALLRFVELEGKPPLEPDTFTIIRFEKYVAENKLTSPVISQCNCNCDVTNRELIFNTCFHCRGPINKDFLAGDL